MSVKLVYFAWVRERIGRAEEIRDLPSSVHTVADVVNWLVSEGPEYANAFAQPDVIRAAVDHEHVGPTTPVKGAREIAFFPPVTGG